MEDKGTSISPFPNNRKRDNLKGGAEVKLNKRLLDSKHNMTNSFGLEAVLAFPGLLFCCPDWGMRAKCHYGISNLLVSRVDWLGVPASLSLSCPSLLQLHT